MDNKINLSQLSDLFAQASGMSRNASDRFIRTFFDTIADKVISDGTVKVKGFGTFKLTSVDNRESINVNTGERFVIEGYRKISFTPDAELKEAVNSPFAAFETVMLTDEQADVLDNMETVPGAAEQSKPVEPEEPKSVEPEQLKPVVKEITQKRHTAVILRVLAVLLSIILILGILAYLFWPSMATSLMERLCQGYDDEIITESVQPDTVQPYSELTETEQTAVPGPVEEAVEELEQPKEPELLEKAEQPEPLRQAERPKQPVVQQVASASKSAGKVGYVSEKLKVIDADLKRDLSEFTAADTVNYRIAGLMTEHVVAQDETLTRIALKYYGTKKLWPYIAQYNKELNMNKIHPGVKIKIPRLENK